MNRILENGKLTTDLDLNGYSILNAGDLGAKNVLKEFDSRLSDARPPLPASVTDSSVAPGAGIQQSKLSLNGALPTSYLGTDPDTAAAGNLVQPHSAKNAASGYAPLDTGGQIPAASFPALAGTGTVKSVGIALPPDFVTPDPVTTSGPLNVDWAAALSVSLLGNFSGAPASPKLTKKQVYSGLLPGIAASRIVSGLLPLSMLPPAVTSPSSSSGGLLPDPGLSGDPLDYMARDVSFRSIQQVTGYQPTLPSPAITMNGQYLGSAYIRFTSSQLGVNTFYRVNHAGQFIEVTTQPILIADNSIVESYVAKDGYNNSAIASFTIPPLPS